MMPAHSSARSCPVKTATTPGCSFASETSMLVIFAWAKGLRRNERCSIPGSLMLSVHVAWPVTSAGSSLRGTPPPTYFSGASVTTYPLLRRRGLLDGLDDVLVAGAAAQVALEALPDLLLGGVRVLLQEADGSHDHAWRAIAALEAVCLVEGLLHRVPVSVLGDPLYSRDLAPVGLYSQ